MRMGIIGAGHIGKALARLAVAHGHSVMISNSRSPETLRTIGREIGCLAGTSTESADFGELIILAIPFRKIFEMDPGLLDGKVVIDTTNYYPERDGNIAELDQLRVTTSAMVAEHFQGTRLVKAFNAILATDLTIQVLGKPASMKRSLPLAGEDQKAKEVVGGIHRQFGFDVVDAGGLDDSWRFERAKPAYCIPFRTSELEGALSRAERDVELPHGSWRR